MTCLLVPLGTDPECLRVRESSKAAATRTHTHAFFTRVHNKLVGVGVGGGCKMTWCESWRAAHCHTGASSHCRLNLGRILRPPHSSPRLQSVTWSAGESAGGRAVVGGSGPLSLHSRHLGSLNQTSSVGEWGKEKNPPVTGRDEAQVVSCTGSELLIAPAGPRGGRGDVSVRWASRRCFSVAFAQAQIAKSPAETSDS